MEHREGTTNRPSPSWHQSRSGRQHMRVRILNSVFIVWPITGLPLILFRDAGYFGQGMYFSSNANYILPYFAVKKNPAILLCYLIPGNIYPGNPFALFSKANFGLVTEDHKSFETLAGSPLKAGFQCHYVVTDTKGCVNGNCENVGCDEFVIQQESQVIFSHCHPLQLD